MTQRYIGGLIYNPPGGYSGYFNGSSSYLSAPDNAAWYFTGDFTVECWAYWNNTSSSEANVLAQHRPASSANQAINFYSDTTTLYFVYNSSSVSTKIAAGQWYHLAMSCTSGTASSYINGALVGTFSMPSRIDSADPFTIGVRTGSGGSGVTGYFPGYISNVRVINGTGIYSGSSITVPSGALQNITNTKLLTCQSATFIDNSSSPFTITNNGASVSTQNPFPLTTLPNPAQGNAGNGIFSMSQYQSLKQQNLWSAIDPYFDYTTLLLHGNGTNGGQNNTFQDSSTNNFTITRNGNTTQGTFSPFSLPAGTWSNYFPGSSSIQMSSSSSFNINTYDTLECWVNLSVLGTNNLFLGREANYWLGYNHTSIGGTANKFVFSIYNGSSWQAVSSSTSPSAGVWYHILGVKDNTTLRIYINGVQENTATFSGSPSNSSYNVFVGANNTSESTTGYVSNARLITGASNTVFPYSGLTTGASFTVPTSSLTNVSGTAFLTCQSNRFVDNGTANSGSGFTVSVNGTSSVQAFSPFAPTAAYSASTVGGSGYFDGSGDYLQYPVITLGSSDVTAECWVYLNSLGNQEIFGINYNSDQSSYGAIRVQIASNTLRFMGTTSGSSFAFGPTSASKTPAIGEWAHIAVVRSGTTFTLYLNGTSVATATGISGSLYAGTFGGRVGSIYWSGGNDYLNGYVSNFRIVAGTAVYTGAFTPPTAPLSTSGSASSSAYPSTTNVNTSFASSECSLLLNFTNAAIIDNTAKNVLETVGNAQISTAQSKFGGGSFSTGATSGANCLTAPASPSLQMMTGNFTVEGWFLPDSGTTGTERTFYIQGVNTTGGLALFVGTGGARFRANGQTDLVYNGTISTSVFTHIAFVRNGNTRLIFVNGTQVASDTLSFNNNDLDTVNIGAPAKNASDVYRYFGYIDDLRITKGIARYTGNFTPQTSQWQDQ